LIFDNSHKTKNSFRRLSKYWRSWWWKNHEKLYWTMYYYLTVKRKGLLFKHEKCQRVYFDPIIFKHLCRFVVGVTGLWQIHTVREIHKLLLSITLIITLSPFYLFGVMTGVSSNPIVHTEWNNAKRELMICPKETLYDYPMKTYMCDKLSEIACTLFVFSILFTSNNSKPPKKNLFVLSFQNNLVLVGLSVVGFNSSFYSFLWCWTFE
jgi:hypothetical protein